MKMISLVTPCYNEEAGIRECYATCRRIMEEELSAYPYEHIFIDNCSTDGTVAILKEIAAADKRVKIIVNARNFGSGRSPYHGLMQASGDVMAPILADLQTPPSILPDMVAKWEAGYKIIVAVRRASEERGLLALTRRAFYALIKRVSKIEQIPNYIGYGLYDRAVIDVLRALNEPDPYFRGLIPEIGFDRAVVEYDQPARRHGESQHNLMDLIDVALLGITTYSKAPMRIMTISGFVIASLSLVAAFIYFCLKLLLWSQVPFGITPILLATLFFGSVQLLALGLLGEYVGLLLQYARRFPVVVEKERINFN
jgi:polyisoprenyl-phosphate glycosyltransferase